MNLVSVVSFGCSVLNTPQQCNFNLNYSIQEIVLCDDIFENNIRNIIDSFGIKNYRKESGLLDPIIMRIYCFNDSISASISKGSSIIPTLEFDEFDYKMEIEEGYLLIQDLSEGRIPFSFKKLNKWDDHLNLKCHKGRFEFNQDTIWYNTLFRKNDTIFISD